MKIAIYCQHVLGIGHFFRILEICRAFSKHEVILITGGEPVDVPLPDHVREIRLPSLMMDSDFKHMFSSDSEQSLEHIKIKRKNLLLEIFKRELPLLFIIELYPFGRKAFRFELDPVLNAIKEDKTKPCQVVCSLRDILVEKKDVNTYENRVIKTLNTFFDALLVHSDPDLVKLDATFSQIKAVKIPIVYTGFITPKTPENARKIIQTHWNILPEEKIIIASAGGGKVGGPLLTAAANTFKSKYLKKNSRLFIFTGPFMSEDLFLSLKKFENERIHVARFTQNFLCFLAAADLSVSMAGYNTCMNIMSAGVPALVWPFAQNQEQRLRAERLGLRVLEDSDLNPSNLAKIIDNKLSQGRKNAVNINLDGAAQTAQWLIKWIDSRS